jgi:integral membrane protein
MPLKYYAGEPQYVRFVGSAHGFFFLSYVGAAFVMFDRFGWSLFRLIQCVVLSSVPFGVWYFEVKYLPQVEE